MAIHRRLIERIYARTNRYANCHSRLHPVVPDYSGAWVDQQDNARSHKACVAMSCIIACQASQIARSLSNQALWDTMKKETASIRAY
ncbi:hypothetical protein TNCV_4874211 [Trichonephila clavipes]|nr:hypothetical protein TNCV_4874211 [Trichonephila clavipes]